MEISTSSLLATHVFVYRSEPQSSALSMSIPTLTSALGQLVFTRLRAPLFFGVLARAMQRTIVRHQRRDPDYHAALRDAAILEGLTLAARTIRHHLGNRLAVAVGYSEILAEDPRLPPDLQDQANEIISSARTAVAVVDKFQRVARVRVDTTVAGPKLLDLDASTAACD